MTNVKRQPLFPAFERLQKEKSVQFQQPELEMTRENVTDTMESAEPALH